MTVASMPIRPLRSFLLALFVAGGAYAAGCARGDDGLATPPVASPSIDGGASQPQSAPPASAADAAGPVSPGSDASTVPEDASPPDSTAGDDGAADASLDASPDVAPPPVDAAPTVDASQPDASDAGLSPLLSVPAPGSQACSSIGEDVDCPLGDVCLISTPSSGACESCVACHGYQHSCNTDDDCGPPYQCYANVCSYLCRIGHHDCSSLGEQCVNVGNAQYGVCTP
jgi:hypothetical protein